MYIHSDINAATMKRKHPAKSQSFSSVWDALADMPEEAANLRARTDLMRSLSDFITARGWTQKEAAARCHLTQPRINDLLRGCISRFSLDALVNIDSELGLRIYLELKAA